MKKIALYLLFIANIFVILWFWWPTNGSLLRGGDVHLALLAEGRLSGLLAVYFVLCQLTLIGRVKWVESVFGLDRLSRVHHWNGFFVLLFILAHPVMLIAGSAGLARVGLVHQFLEFFREYDDVANAVIALLLFLLVIATSLLIVRRRWRYETWYFTHLLTYAAILLAFGHQLEVGSDFQNNPTFVLYWYLLYIVAGGNFVWFRFLRPLLFFWRHRFYIDRVERETDEVASVYIGGRNIDQFPGQAGQFMILRFLAKSFWWQAHPFSFSQKPDGRFLRVTIKNVGDFTSNIPALKPGTLVFIDGPHGVFTEKPETKNKILLIGGGIGITPLRALAEEMIANGKDVSLLYGNRSGKNIALKNELDELAKSRLRVNYVVSDDPSWTGIKGHVNATVIKNLVPDFSEREVYLCGPAPMMKSVRSELSKLGVQASLVHYEKFSLA